MKIAITGHSSGIGHQLDLILSLTTKHDIQGYSKSNGWNIAERDGDKIVEELIDFDPDVFFNNAYYPQIQNKILENSAKILKKNGLIMYVTCSLQKIEGERRIEDFLKSHKQFSIVRFNSEDYPKINDSITKEGFIRILPNHFNFNLENVSNGSDGFFIALLKKEK